MSTTTCSREPARIFEMSDARADRIGPRRACVRGRRRRAGRRRRRTPRPARESASVSSSNMLRFVLAAIIAAKVVALRHFADAPIEGPLPLYSLDGSDWTATNSRLNVSTRVKLLDIFSANAVCPRWSCLSSPGRSELLHCRRRSQ